MENQLARGLSFLFHPLLVPCYCLLLLLNTESIVPMDVPVAYQLTLLGIVFLITFLFPLFLTYLLFRLQMISSFFLPGKEERTYLIAAVAVFYYVTYYLLKGIPIAAIFGYYMLGATIMAILAMIINFYFKISLHMIGLGSLTGLFSGLSFKYGINFYGIILTVIILAGITGFARLKLLAHTPAEIYSGFLLGIAILTLLIMAG